MTTENKRYASTKLEKLAMCALPIVTSTAAVYALDTYGYLDADQVRVLPLIDHSSSIAGGYSTGVVGGYVTERCAQKLEDKGYIQAAERLRRASMIATTLGSLACQVFIETSTRGVGDKWDVVAGVTATIPGVLASKALTKK